MSMIKHAPTSSFLAGNDSSERGSEWNDQLTRRRFLKRSGAASAATIIAWNLTSKPALAEAASTGKSDEEKVWKKRRWACKLTLAGPRNTPYTAEEISALSVNYANTQSPPYPFIGDPEGPPTGGRVNDSDGTKYPQVLEKWVQPEGYTTSCYRDPTNPTLQNWQNPADGKYWAAWIYDYIESKWVSNGTGP
jgi:hypothetical protein